MIIASNTRTIKFAVLFLLFILMILIVEFIKLAIRIFS
ncbi:putative membrane protein [Methanobacterium formicicum]|uniref:Putative membrane protein n=1 Tax=Methanobacterium formicicum TaxID=2162 RepID=A0A090JXF2_METFO|nr:putative membrane protein [Methanobacterium formicicum]